MYSDVRSLLHLKLHVLIYYYKPQLHNNINHQLSCKLYLNQDAKSSSNGRATRETGTSLLPVRTFTFTIRGAKTNKEPGSR